MADYVVKGESLAAVADAIREKTGETDALGLGEMPGKVGEVYDTGLHAMDGEAQNQTELINQIADVLENKAGKFYDAFWDAFQQNGNKTSYDQAFMFTHWTDDIWNPKYPLCCEGTNGARQVFMSNTLLTDIKVPIYAKNTRLVYTFQNCAALKTVPLLSLEGVSQFNNVFTGCAALEELNVVGMIETNGFDVSPCTKLAHASLMSIINALKDYSGSGTTYTVTLGAENLAKLTDAEKQIATGKGWTLA